MQFCRSQKPNCELKKQRTGQFVANIVTCAVLFVDDVGLFVLENHAENLSFVVTGTAALCRFFLIVGFVSNSRNLQHNFYKHSSCVVANPPKEVYTPAAHKPMISLES